MLSIKGISWEKILKSSPQKRFMMGHTLKSSPILREPEPDFGDSTAPFQDNIFKIIFNLQVMGCLPHHFDTLQSNNPQFPLQDNEQSIPSIIITEEKSSENSIKKKISNKSRIPRHTPVSDESNRKQQGSSSVNVPETSSEQSIVTDNEHMPYNDNGLPELLDSLEIPHCSYKKYKELRNNCAKDCNEHSNYLGNQNTIVLREDLDNNLLQTEGLISSIEEAYKCDNYKVNKNTGSRNIKAPAFTVKHENACSEIEKSSCETRKIKNENSFNEGSEDVCNELKLTLQENNQFDVSHLYEHETVNNSDNWKNFSGFNENKNSCVQIKELKNMTDGKLNETIINGSIESNISEIANGYSSEQNREREDPICSTKLEVNEKHDNEVVSDTETVNNECVSSNDQHIVRKLEAQINKFDAGISLRLISNSQTLISKQDVITKLSCKSNDDQSYQKSIYEQPIEVDGLTRKSENINMLNNENNIYRNHSGCETNDLNYYIDSNSDKSAVGTSENALVLQDNLDKVVCILNPLCIIGNNYDNSNNLINSDVNSHADNFECNILTANSRDHINVDEILEMNDDLKSLTNISNKYEIYSNSTINNDNFECNILQDNVRDQINDEILEIKQYCADICMEILNQVFDHSNNDKIALNNEVLTNENYRCNVDETITENFKEIIAANVSSYFKDIVDEANKNIINDIKEFVHELKTLQNTLDQHEQQSIQANEMEGRLKDLQNIFNSGHESESDEQIATICDIKPCISPLNNTVTAENINKETLNEGNNAQSSNIDINVAVDKSYNLNNNLDFITYGVWKDTQNDGSDKINSGKTSECQFKLSEENSFLLHTDANKNSSEDKKGNNEINCNILQTNLRNDLKIENFEVNNSLKNELEENHFNLNSNFSNTNGVITLQQEECRTNSNEQVVENESFESEKENVIRNNIKNELECNFDIESQEYLTSESVNDINKPCSYENIVKRFEENNESEQCLLKNYETKNINQYSQLNNVERDHKTENECCSPMQRESDIMGLLQNRQILAEKLESQSEKTDEAEKIEMMNLKHECFQETFDNQYLPSNNFKGNTRKKWNIKSNNETVFSSFENSEEEKSILDVESIDSVGYCLNNNSFLENRTLNDQADSSLLEHIFGKTDDNINTFSESQENYGSDRLVSFKLQNASDCSQESETNKEDLNNVNPSSYPIVIDSCKHFIDKVEWGELQSYDYLEFIINRINIKTSLMERNQIDNIQIKLLNNDSTSDLKKSKVNQESNQFTMKESEEETSFDYLDYCLNKSDIAYKVNEHTADYFQGVRYDSEYHNEIKSQDRTSKIIFIPDKESENRNFKCENNSRTSQQNVGKDGKILDKDVDILSISEKDTNCQFKHFEVSKVSEDLQKESGLWTERKLSSTSESQSFHDLGTLHNSSVYKCNSADIENLNNDIEFTQNIVDKSNADLINSIPDVCQTYYNSNSEGSSQNNILQNLPIAANYINSRFLAAETSECNITSNNKDVIVTNVDARNILKPEKTINTGQKQSFDMFWEYDGYYSQSFNEDFEAHKTCEDASDEKYKFYKEIFEKMIEEIGDIEKEQSSENIKEKPEINADLNIVNKPEIQRQDINSEHSNEKLKKSHGNLEVYNRNSSDKFSGSKVYWSSVGLVVENNDDPNTLPCCEQSDENFMEEAESGCVDLIYPEEGKKNLGAEDNFGSTSDTAVNSNTDFILNKDALQNVNKQDNCEELGEPVIMKVRKKNKFMQRIRSFFSSSIKVGAKVKKAPGDK